MGDRRTSAPYESRENKDKEKREQNIKLRCIPYVWKNVWNEGSIDCGYPQT